MDISDPLVPHPGPAVPTGHMGTAKFLIGTPVRHRVYGFRGVIFDVDPMFGNTDEWYERIPPDVRPRKDQPFYHLLAETVEKAPYIAYVSEQNLVTDDEAEEPIQHPEMEDYFTGMEDGLFILRQKTN